MRKQETARLADIPVCGNRVTHQILFSEFNFDVYCSHENLALVEFVVNGSTVTKYEPFNQSRKLRLPALTIKNTTCQLNLTTHGTITNYQKTVMRRLLHQIFGDVSVNIVKYLGDAWQIGHKPVVARIRKSGFPPGPAYKHFTFPLADGLNRISLSLSPGAIITCIILIIKDVPKSTFGRGVLAVNNYPFRSFYCYGLREPVFLSFKPFIMFTPTDRVALQLDMPAAATLVLMVEQDLP